MIDIPIYYVVYSLKAEQQVGGQTFCGIHRLSSTFV